MAAHATSYALVLSGPLDFLVHIFEGDKGALLFVVYFMGISNVTLQAFGVLVGHNYWHAFQEGANVRASLSLCDTARKARLINEEQLLGGAGSWMYVVSQ